MLQTTNRVGGKKIFKGLGKALEKSMARRSAGLLSVRSREGNRENLGSGSGHNVVNALMNSSEYL